MFARSRAALPPSQSLAAFLLALLLIGVATGFGLTIAPRWGTTAVVLLYLPPVLAAAVYGGLWPSLLAAAVGTLAFNYFFTRPFHSLAIHSPADVMTVVVLFGVGLVTSRLAGSLRSQAARADANAARNATIAGFAGRLLSQADARGIAQVAVEEVARLFDCLAVVVCDIDKPQVLAGAPANPVLSASDVTAAAWTLSSGEPAGRGLGKIDPADWQFRPVASQAGVLAAVGLARIDGAMPVLDSQLPLLQNLLDQMALALERARVEVESRAMAALRERDRFRIALLASIGDDFKPRIKAMIAATRELKRAGQADRDTVNALAADAAHLDRYVDNLTELSPGEQPEAIRTGELTIDLHHRCVERNGRPVSLTPKEYAVLAELAKHTGEVLTTAQLLRRVWGAAQEDRVDYLRVAISALRRKVEADPANPQLILNVPAVGYRLAVLT